MKAMPNIKLKTILISRGVTQRELSFSIGLDESRLSRIVRGYEKPTPEVQEAIAEFFDLPEEELFLKTREPFTAVTLRAHND